ncbi:hypothetical protein [Bordetella genomosp. 9]|uniref:hypothetical protein n=1 Tax=Bordetella genomosp. 9 TaxID=1416803 RepID=UPI001177B9F2|nr:hypothetical protein [Bordetella genomosp. 9]
MTNIDYIGLALELEGHANSPRIDSQTIQRAMLAAAHALRLTHESILSAASEAEPVAYRYRHSESEKWHYGPTPQSWWECQALYAAPTIRNPLMVASEVDTCCRGLAPAHECRVECGGTKVVASEAGAVPVYYRYRHSENEKWHYGPKPQSWWECQALGVIAAPSDAPAQQVDKSQNLQRPSVDESAKLQSPAPAAQDKPYYPAAAAEARAFGAPAMANALDAPAAQGDERKAFMSAFPAAIWRDGEDYPDQMWAIERLHGFRAALSRQPSAGGCGTHPDRRATGKPCL